MFIGGDPGAAGIYVTFTTTSGAAPVDDFCDTYAGRPGVESCGRTDVAAWLGFESDASGSQVAEISLELERDPRIADVLVSQIDEAGENIIKP